MTLRDRNPETTWLEKTTVRAAAMLLVLLAGLANATQSLADEPSAVELDYKIYVGGLHALSMTINLSRQSDAAYRMAVDAATDGFIGALVDARYYAESEGVTEDNMASPRRFHGISGQDGDEDLKTVTVVYRDGAAPDVAFAPPQETPSDPLSADVTTATVDPPSAMVTLMETLGATGLCDATVKVFDGKRRYNLTSHHGGELYLKASSVAPYDGTAVECRVGIERIAGFRTGRFAKRYPDEITIFLASVIEGSPPVPVRLHSKNMFGALRMHLTAVRGAGAQDAATE